MLICNRQEELFTEMINSKIPELVKSYSTSLRNCNVSLECLPIIRSNVKEVNGTRFITVTVKCIVEDTESDEMIETFFDVLNIPVLEKAGFMYNHKYIQILDLYDRVSGWTFTSDYSEEVETEDGSINEEYKGRAAALYATNKRLLTFIKTKTGIYVSLPNKKKVLADVFLNALTDYDLQEVLAMFGVDNKYALHCLTGKYDPANSTSTLNKAACIKRVHELTFSNYTGTEKLLIDYKKDLERTFYSKMLADLGISYADRLERAMSFSYRALDKTLAEDIILDGKVIVKAGTILTEGMLSELDLLPIDSIRISFHNKVYNLLKFSNLTFRALGSKLKKPIPELELPSGTELTVEVLTKINKSNLEEITVENASGEAIVMRRRAHPATLAQEDLLTAFGIYVCILNGLDTFDNPDELTNRVSITFDRKILQAMRTNLDGFMNKLESSLTESITNKNRLLFEKMPEATFMTERYMNELRSRNDVNDFKENQMADMNNALHFISKGYKVMSDCPKRSTTDEMRMVQDTQLGRTDPIDSPESNKIGLVHERTLFAKETEEGYLTTPYLQVLNGVVISDKPEYLTAAQESNKYIAEWDETFVNEDGTLKNTVQARYNGNIVTVDSKLVTLQEYTQLQNMSPARSLIPFMGNSNAKRLLMACNHQKQALTTVRTERPIVGTGVEALLDVGNYTASDIIEKYFSENVNKFPMLKNHEKEIRESSITLAKNGIYEEHNAREYRFVIDYLEDPFSNLADLEGVPTTVSVTVTYLQKTAEKSMYTYRIRPAESYRGDDIVIYNMSYDLKNYDILKNVDYGHYKVDDKTFENAYGTGRNLVIGYKTYESVIIDDAIGISSDLVYEDAETTITIITEKVHLRKGDSENNEFTERFGKVAKIREKTIGANGLVKTGVILKPGDPIACVIRTSINANGSSVESEPALHYLSEFKSGQVVSSELKEDEEGVYAEIKLASRSAIEVGDKMTGRCGNKGVVAKIIPAEQMPFDPVTGLKLDVILNPLGIPSRMNITQLLEVTLAYAMKLQGKITIQSPYNGNAIDIVREQAEKAGVKPMMLVDGRTGRLFKRPVNVGIQYMNKLVHRAEKKMAAISFDAPSDKIFGQPLKGQSRRGGQSFGEMESWCLQSVGAYKTLQALYSTQSDDYAGRKDLLKQIENNPFEYENVGENKNDVTLQVYANSLGVDITLDEEGNYHYDPLRDSKIMQLNTLPVGDVEQLHNPEIFKDSNSKTVWSYCNLNTKVVSPFWFKKGFVNKYIICKDVNKEDLDVKKIKPRTLGDEIMVQLVKGDARLDLSERIPIVYRGAATHLAPESSMQGMEAIVACFEQYDIEQTKTWYESKIEGMINKVCRTKECSQIDALKSLATNRDYLDLTGMYNNLCNFMEGGSNLSDFVIQHWPIMPGGYRPLMKSNSQIKSTEFDIAYREILKAAKACGEEASISNTYKLVIALDMFLGTNKFVDTTKRDVRERSSLNSWFATKTGKIRERMLSKRLYCAGRSVITPPPMDMKPTEVGVPLAMLVELYKQPLISYISSHLNLEPGRRYGFKKVWNKLLTAIGSQNPSKFCKILRKDKALLSVFCSSNLLELDENNPDIEAIYAVMMALIRSYIEGDDTHEPQVVLVGRQPSLHKFSIRAFNPRIVYGRAMQIHTLVCPGYNADFDGDTMWITALFGDDVKKEAIETMSPRKGVINPKDNSPVIQPQQDVVLGVYCATMLKNNATNVWEYPEVVRDVRYYNSIEELRNDVRLDMVQYYTLVILRHNGKKYYSTAGRILFNDCFENGFTDKPFSNPLNLVIPSNSAFGNNAEFFDLKYDALIAAKGGTRKEIKYGHLGKICTEVFEELGTDCLDTYQRIVQFGFEASDIHSVTLSLDDVDINLSSKSAEEKHEKALAVIDEMEKMNVFTSKVIESNKKVADNLYKEALDGRHGTEMDDVREVIIEEANEKVRKLQRFHQIGILSTNDRKNNTRSIYDSACSKIKKALPAGMDRNNNLFIIYDSGSRGNIGQLMQTAGAVGILQKTNTEDMENAITTNYTKGLSSFDMHQSSYAGRVGVVSTQNETPAAGYATRTAVFMCNGITIVAEDCEKEKSWFDVIYGDFRGISWEPSYHWFKTNLVGKKVADAYSKELFNSTLDENDCITEDSFSIVSDGMKSITVIDNEKEKTYNADLHEMENAILSSDDEDAMRELKYFLNDGRLTGKAVDVIQKHHLTSIETDKGTFRLTYKLDPITRSLLLHRDASAVDVDGMEGLPYLKKVTHNGTTINAITGKTLDYIEERAFKRVPARIFLDCQCKGGICKKCFGLRYSDLLPPEIGENVGVEAAQAIGEPAAQLTMSLFHKGGSAGSSVAGGVEILHHLLDGGNPGGSESIPALVAKSSGYLKIKNLDSKSLVFIKPEDSTVCNACIASSGCGSCPIECGDASKAHCKAGDRVNTNSLIVDDNEFIHAGDAITGGYVLPNDIITLDEDCNDVAHIMRKKQIEWLKTYFDTFKENGIDVNARHFEILARIQNLEVTVLHDPKGEIRQGTKMEVFDLIAQRGDEVNEMILAPRTSSKKEVVRHTGGTMLQLCFEDMSSALADASVGAVVDDNISSIASTLIGNNLAEPGSRKKLMQPAVTLNLSDSLNDLSELDSYETGENLEIMSIFDSKPLNLEGLNEADGIVSMPDFSSIPSFESMPDFSTMPDFGESLANMDTFSSEPEEEEPVKAPEEETAVVQESLASMNVFDEVTLGANTEDKEVSPSISLSDDEDDDDVSTLKITDDLIAPMPLNLFNDEGDEDDDDSLQIKFAENTVMDTNIIQETILIDESDDDDNEDDEDDDLESMSLF